MGPLLNQTRVGASLAIAVILPAALSAQAPNQTQTDSYFLQQPETHAFRLYHDYTETRPEVDRYLNVVRRGSKASNPSAHVLDTGERLRVETLGRGEFGTRDYPGQRYHLGNGGRRDLV
jgi:hypothetical protein